MLNKSITYSLPVLKNLVSSETSCVSCVEQSRRCFFTNPLELGNIKKAVHEHLKSKITTYDAELQGIILSHKNIKVVNSVQLNDDGEFSLDYIADIYIFKPSVGSILTGKVNKKSQDHLGVLVHSVFNATLPRPRNEDECPKTWVSHVKIGDQVTFKVVKVNFQGRLPYIKGKLIEVEERDTEDGDSGIGGHESTEEGAFNNSSTSLDNLVTNSTVNDNISNKKERSSLVANSTEHSGSLPQPSRKKKSILGLPPSLSNEALGKSSSSNAAEKAENETPILDGLGSSNSFKSPKENKPSKKRKSSSSLLEIKNLLIKNAIENINSPEVSNESMPKVKRKRILDSDVEKCNEDLSKSMQEESLESTINNMINSEVSSRIPGKKKLTIDNTSEISLSHIKHKKKKSKETSLIESLSDMERKTVAASEAEIVLSNKKKKKSVSFLDPEISSVDYTEDHSLDTTASDEREMPKHDELNNEGLSGLKEHKKKKKKRSTLSLNDSPSHLLDSIEINSRTEQLQNTSDEAEQSSPSGLKKKKKKSHSFSEESEKSLVNFMNDTVTDKSNNNNKSIEVQELCNVSKEHKKKKKKKSSSMDLGDMLNLEGTDSFNKEDQDAKDTRQFDSPTLFKEHKKKKKLSSTMDIGEMLNLEGTDSFNKDDQDAKDTRQFDSPTLFKEHKKKKKLSSTMDIGEMLNLEGTDSVNKEDQDAKDTRQFDSPTLFKEHKKKKKLSSTMDIGEMLNSEETDRNLSKEHKKKKKLSSTMDIGEMLNLEGTDSVNKEDQDAKDTRQFDSPTLFKEHKKKKKLSSTMDIGEMLNLEGTDSFNKDDQDAKDTRQFDSPTLFKEHKKKKKLSSTMDIGEMLNSEETDRNLSKEHKKKKKKLSGLSESPQQFGMSFSEEGLEPSVESCENELDNTSSFNETTELKLKKKKKKEKF